MKRLFAAIFSGLLLAGAVQGQPAATYDNTKQVVAPPDPFPVVDATNFVNENLFEIFSGGFFTFSDVVNYTNLNVMFAPGFTFDTEPSSQGDDRPANYFVNGNNVSTNLDNSLIEGDTIEVSATNIINRGTISVDTDGLINLTGNNVDISRSVLTLGDIGNRTQVEPSGLVDNFWGFGTNVWNPVINLSPTSPTTGNFMMTNIVQIGEAHPQTNFDLSFVSTNPPPALLTAVEVMLLTNNVATGTNRTDQIVFLNNPNTNLLHTRVLFAGNTGYQLGTVIIAISANPYTNLLGQAVTNSLYFIDTFGANPTNGVITNFNVAEGIGLTGPPFIVPQIYTYEPNDFLLTRTPPAILKMATNGTPYIGHPNDNYSTLTPGTTTTANFAFWGTNLASVPTVISNWYAGYEIGLVDTTWPIPPPGPPDQTLQEQVRELPGRIELNASSGLKMDLTRIQGLNYILYNSTNQFVSSSNAAASAAFADLMLGSTNGTLTVSNLFQPLVPRYTGIIDVYSGWWSNQFATGVSNGGGFLVATNFAPAENEALFVDLSGLSPSSFSTVLDMNLHSVATNGQPGQINIGDSFNDIEGNFTINPGASLTVLSNATIGLDPADIPGPQFYDQYWNDGVPALNSFTNFGTVFGPNTMYFEDAALAPDGSNLPYNNFVNEASGFISDEGTVVSANYFENRGFIFSDTGETFITASNAVLIGIDVLPYSSAAYWANSALFQAFANISSSSSDISITCTNLTMTNQFLNPGRALDLNISGALNAGTNFFLVNDGINVGTKPATGDFNRVTVVDSAVPFEQVNNIWAGTDLGPVASAFTNNAALGRLVLDGGANTAFTFSAAGPGNNALYVDVIEFRNNITNVDSAGNLLNVSVQPGMMIYYGSAYSWIGGLPQPFTTNLLGKNNGAFMQVNHPGVIHTASEPATFSGVTGTTTYDFGLAVTVSSSPSPKAAVSWNTIAGAENYLYYENGLGGQWQLLTNFVSSATGTVCVPDALGNRTRFYRVIVSGP